MNKETIIIITLAVIAIVVILGLALYNLKMVNPGVFSIFSSEEEPEVEQKRQEDREKR